MKVSTKLTLMSLVVSSIPILTVIWMAKGKPLFHQEDFHSVAAAGLAISILAGLIIPLLCARWLFLSQLHRIRDLCNDIRSGKYTYFHLPNEPSEKEFENEFTSLMRDINWMINRMHIRENQLKDMLTKLKTSERALQKSEMHYRRLVENMRDIVFITDVKGNFEFISRQVEKVIHYDPQNMIGRNIREFLTSDSLSFFEKNFRRQLQDKAFHPYEVWFKSSNEKHVPIEINASPLFGSKGEIIGVEGVARDMSEHKSLEKELIQAQKMEAIGTLAGGIAHDFNNIIQGVLGFTELLLMNKAEDDTDYEELTQIKKQAINGSKLTRQLLTFSRKAESQLQPVNLNTLIRKFRGVLARTIPRMIDIEFQLTNNLKTVNADPGQIEQIIMNLTINARDAMPDGGKLVFKTENLSLRDFPGVAPGEYILLSVSDSGTGMDRDTLVHIFEPFYTTKEAGKGTGLGLAVVHGIVKSHNGYIHCESSFGKGTTFKIYLPVLDVEEETGVAKEIDQKKIVGGTENILLVDDEEVILDFAERIMKQYGYNIITAKSGEAAIIEVEKRKSVGKSAFDLVILDLNMPGMGGYKCLEQLVKMDPDIKVLVASGYSEFQKEDIRKAGVRGFLAKPYGIKQLLKTVRTTLDGRLGSSSDADRTKTSFDSTYPEGANYRGLR